MFDLPALLGGPPVSPEGPPSWPPADPAITEALSRACQDGSWGQYQATHVTALEEHLRQLTGLSGILTCGSGTFAVELALRALKAGPGDEVVMAAYDYPGNFLTIHALGAQPVLVDLAPGSWCLAPDQLESAFTSRTRAVLASHLHGGMAPMKEIREICDRHGIPLLEDAAQAPGGIVQGKPVGAWGDVAVMSFGGSKLLSAGRGGALLTSDASILQRARRYQLRGNLVCPLSELQAIVLLPQLHLLAERTRKRHEAVRFLQGRLAALPGIHLLANPLEGTTPAYYKLGFFLEEQTFGLPRPLLASAMRAEGIALDEGFAALHVGRSPSRYRASGELMEACRIHAGVLVLHHPVLLETQTRLEQVAVALEKIHAHAAALVAMASQ